MIQGTFLLIIFGSGIYIGYIIGKETTLEWVNKQYRSIENDRKNT